VRRDDQHGLRARLSGQLRTPRCAPGVGLCLFQRVVRVRPNRVVDQLRRPQAAVHGTLVGERGVAPFVDDFFGARSDRDWRVICRNFDGGVRVVCPIGVVDGFPIGVGVCSCFHVLAMPCVVHRRNVRSSRAKPRCPTKTKGVPNFRTDWPFVDVAIKGEAFAEHFELLAVANARTGQHVAVLRQRVLARNAYILVTLVVGNLNNQFVHIY
jgi:hypothetical protein